MKKILTIICLSLLIALFAINLSPADEPPDRLPGFTFIIKGTPPDCYFHKNSCRMCVPDQLRDYVCFYNFTDATVTVVNEETPPGQVPFTPFELAPKESKCLIFDCTVDKEGNYKFTLAECSNAECTAELNCECTKGGYGPSLTEWGIIILLLLFIGTGTWVVLRRRKVTPA